MGSFRLVAGNRHLHRYYNFAGRAVETVPKSLRLSCGSELTDKEFRYLRTVIVTGRRSLGLQFNALTSPLNLQHRAGVSSYTSSFDLAQTCVFGKQLLGPFPCGCISAAPLLPKLRVNLPSFLNNPSPVGLRIFFLPTCVGLRYGHLRNTHSFSRHLPCRTSVLISLDLYRTNSRLRHFRCVPMLNSFGGDGISTVCASATPSGLTLAPD